MPRYAAFLSYSRKDTDALTPFREEFEARGVSVWLDKTEISGGDAWEASIRRGLTQSNCLVVFVSQNVLDSYVKKEIAIARDMRKPIIPVAMDDAIQTDIPEIGSLREFHYIDARARGSEAAQELVAAVAKKDSAPVLSVYNVKGGVGKTTLAMNLAMYFYRQSKKRVLLVDFDPQTNLSTALVLPRVEKRGGGMFGMGRRNERVEVLEPLQKIGKSVLGVMREAIRLAPDPDADFQLPSFVHTIEGTAVGPTLDIVVGDPELYRLALASSARDVPRARDGFARFVGQCRAQYNVILIDMGPAVNELSLCALGASTHVLSPVTPNRFAVQGLNLLDDISVGDDAAAFGREHLIVINQAEKKESVDVVRQQISTSRFGPSLLESELRASETFNLKPQTSVSSSLNFLPAYGAWSGNLSPVRQSLQKVALEIGKRTGVTV